MRIWTFSDLHLQGAWADIERVLGPIPDADVCICSGDLIEGFPDEGVRWLDEHIGRKMPVLYVLGNHEHYNHDRDMETNRRVAQAAAWKTEGRVEVLDDMSTTIGGIRFHGTTLWTDFALNGSDDVSLAYAMESVRHSMNDYRFRAGADHSRKWSPELSRREHQISRAWLEASLGASDLPNIVVSHHAPHPGSIAPEYEMDLATTAFVSDLSPLIERHQPALWLHGHVHSSWDYQIGQTRIVANPKGYGRENERGFDPGLVLEIDAYEPKPPGL
jgi:Icc-related predicted phosphoesterase